MNFRCYIVCNATGFGMFRVFYIVSLAILMSDPAATGHFFLPSRSFFCFRPDNFLNCSYGHSCLNSGLSCHVPNIVVTLLLRLEAFGYQSYQADLESIAGRTVHLDVELDPRRASASGFL